MKTLLFWMKMVLLLFICQNSNLFAYNPDSVQPDSTRFYFGSKGEKIYLYPDKMPGFPGGEQGLLDFLGQNIRYPEPEICIQGCVVIQFVVKKDGSLSDVELLKSLYSSFDKETLRVVSLMPDWIAGKVGDSLVNCRFYLPVRFSVSANIPDELRGKKTRKEQRPEEKGLYKDLMPVFPGGSPGLETFLKNNMVYPPKAIRDSLEGSVRLQFEIKGNGEVGEIKILQSLSPECDAECIRLIRRMPRWLYPPLEDVPDAVYFTLPIYFKKNNN